MSARDDAATWAASLGVFGSGPGADFTGSLGDPFVIAQLEATRRLAAGGPRHPGVLGGLLLTLLLLWAYFQFMPFLIIWSGNLPDGVGWYLARRSTGWVAAIVAASVLGGVPLFALFAPQVRTSRRWLGVCAVAVLAGKAIEFAWLALPGRGPLAVLAWLLTLAGLGCLALAALLRAARLAEARR